MPERKGKSTRSAKAILKEARSILASAADRVEKRGEGSGSGSGDSISGSRGGELIQHCEGLVRDFHQLLRSGSNFDFKDWSVVKAVVELVVRWGIYPYLSSGVGIPLQKRFGEKAASAAATAVSDYIRGCESIDVDLQRLNLEVELNVEVPEIHPLVSSADLLSSLVLEKIITSDDYQKSNREIFLDSPETEMKGKYTQDEEEAEQFEGKYTPAIESSPGALRQLIISHHLIDILAALLQILHGEQLGSKSWKQEAFERIKFVVKELPVDYVVEALFSLLGQNSPPPWLKPEVGKLLSQVVMRTGGLSTVMDRLVGGVERGNVHVYERVAAHLAKVPRQISAKDEYYKAVCTDLRILLLLPDVSYSDSIESKVQTNMHHTCIILACNLAHQEPNLTEQYLLQPILEPLSRWSEVEATKSVCSDESKTIESSTGLPSVSETSLLGTLHILQKLLTAGHNKPLRLRQELLRLTSPLVPKLLLVNYIMWPSYGKHNIRIIESKSSGPLKGEYDVDKSPVKKGGLRKDFAAGFLKEKRLAGPGEDDEKPKGDIGRLVTCISDVVDSHLAEPMSHSLPILLQYLLDLSISSVRWPSAEGEIADAFKLGINQPDSAAMFLSKLLLKGESWELTVGLLVTMLKKALQLRRDALLRSESSARSCIPNPTLGAGVDPEVILNTLQTLEVIYSEVGMKAIEKDAAAALPLLKILLDDDYALEDGEILELVLPLLHAAVRQLHEEQKEEKVPTDSPPHSQISKRTEQNRVLHSLALSLEKVTQSPTVPKEAKDFAASLRTTISQHFMTPTAGT